MKNIRFGTVFLLALLSVTTFAAPLVDWSSVEGMRRLASSREKAPFARLANNFQAQTDRLTCGPVTATIVLNALRANTPRAPFTPLAVALRAHLPEGFEARVRRYTPETFLESVQRIKTTAQIYGQPIEGRKDFGLQLRQLHAMFVAHGVRAEIRVVDQALTNDAIKAQLRAALATTTTYVVVNYARQPLGQAGGGHISPVGAYDETTDSFLVLDVNPAAASWSWVETADLIGAMRTRDTVENRGYLLVSEAAE